MSVEGVTSKRAAGRASVPLALGIAVPLAALLTGCQSGTFGNYENSEAASGPAELAGYGRLRFGMPFNEVIADLGGDMFNPSAIVNCARDMPLRGCFLSRNHERVAPFAMRDGIPYMLDVSFNRLDHVTDIVLSYEREGDISSDQCLQLSARTLDWLTRDYGAFRPQGHADAGARISQVRTTAGNALPVTVTPDHGFVAMTATRLRGGRVVNLLALTFSGAAGLNCRITVNFGEPDSVERPDLSEHGSAG